VPPPADDSKIRVILLDIEGTTTPVDFVYKTLFPYASSKVELFLREHARDPEIQLLTAELRAQNRRDDSAGLVPPAWIEGTEEARLNSSVRYVHWLVGQDSKSTTLKTLQGKIWQQGYERDELHGEVYADVPAALSRWRRQGREIGIYSSGSVLAQQLLFRNTVTGDLTEYISHFFDTRIGAKTESGSYTRIAQELGHPADQVLFISDAIKEIEAARVASMQGALCVRESKAALHPDGETIISTFDQIFAG
jgi:enolase-phosphatase E1